MTCEPLGRLAAPPSTACRTPGLSGQQPGTSGPRKAYSPASAHNRPQRAYGVGQVFRKWSALPRICGAVGSDRVCGVVDSDRMCGVVSDGVTVYGKACRAWGGSVAVGERAPPVRADRATHGMAQ